MPDPAMNNALRRSIRRRWANPNRLAAARAGTGLLQHQVANALVSPEAQEASAANYERYKMGMPPDPNMDRATMQAMFDNMFGVAGVTKNVLGKAVRRALSPEAEVVKALKGLKRVRTTGQYVGAPPGVNTPTKLKKMIKKYQTAMIAGKGQREWYTTSGRSIFSHAGDDPVLANKLTEAFATTSANTGVVANTGHAVKGHNQAVLNQAVNTGQLPGTMGPTIEDVYRAGGSTTGMKRTPFGENLALGGGFRSVPNPRPVHDVWDVRAHGYGDNWKGSVSPPQHEFLDTVDNAIIDQANTKGLGGVKDWNPLRSQAAAWRGQQNELALAKGKPVPQGMYDFSENLPRHAAQGSREAIPGAKTGHMPELQSAPRAVQESYDDEVANIMYDAQGRDFIAMGNQALAGGHIKGPGIFNQASTVPGRQTMTPVGSNAVDVTIPSTGKTIATREVDPASRALMDANEAQYAFHTGQDAAAWSKTYPSPKPGRDSFELELPGGTITHDQAILMMEQAGINPEGIAVVPTPQGVRLVNLIGEQSDAFDDIAKQAAQALGVKRPAGVRASPGYMENVWNKPKNQLGQAYAQQFDPKNIPVLGDRFDATAPGIAKKMRDLDTHFSKQHGFTVSSVMQELRQAVSSDGRAGIKAMAKRLGLPAYSVAALTVAAEQLDLLEPRSEAQREAL